MSQAVRDLPDPLEPSPALAISNADDLLSKMADDAIDQLMADAEKGHSSRAPLPMTIAFDPPAEAIDARPKISVAGPAIERSPESVETADPPAIDAESDAEADGATAIDAEAVEAVLRAADHVTAPADAPAIETPAADGDAATRDAAVTDIAVADDSGDDDNSVVPEDEKAYAPAKVPACGSDVPLDRRAAKTAAPAPPVADEPPPSTMSAESSAEPPAVHEAAPPPAADRAALLAEATERPSVLLLPLWLLNAPFAWMTDGTRRFVGLLGVVTLVPAAAAIIYVIWLKKH